MKVLIGYSNNTPRILLSPNSGKPTTCGLGSRASLQSNRKESLSLKWTSQRLELKKTIEPGISRSENALSDFGFTVNWWFGSLHKLVKLVLIYDVSLRIGIYYLSRGSAYLLLQYLVKFRRLSSLSRTAPDELEGGGRLRIFWLESKRSDTRGFLVSRPMGATWNTTHREHDSVHVYKHKEDIK